MEKDKSVKEKIMSLIGPLIILAVILAGVLVITFWKEEEEPEEIIQVNGYEGEAEEYVLENDSLKLVLDAATTQFEVTDKSSGSTWYSNPADAESDSIALTNEKNNLRSTLLLTYSTINGVDTLYDNYHYSIENGIYDIEQGEDYIKVCYSIGNTEKEYIIPPVIEAGRMEELMAAMSKGDATRVSDYYKKYDINNLGKKDDKEELLAQYPVMETEIIYVLRSTAKDNIKTKLEEYFAAAGYTIEEYAQDKELDRSISSSDKPVFNVNVVYRLDGEDLLVEVPLREIDYREEYPVYSLTLLPYFGAAGVDENGYMIVPEGGGAVIDFNNGKTSQNSYYVNVYGWDMATDREAVVHETRTYFNVFGEAKEDASFICILEDGASYASIQADISGKSNSYNYVNAVYSLVHREQYDVSDRTTSAMYIYEDMLPDESLVQRYCFMDTNKYTDMAGQYREYLLDRYDGCLVLNDDTQTPVVVEILGAVDKVKQVAGVPVSKPLELTTCSEAQEMIEGLCADGFGNLSVKLTGWLNGGVQQKMMSRVKLVSELGSVKDFKRMISSADSLGVELYLDGITNYAYDSDLSDGFFAQSDAARFVSKEKAELYPYNTVSYNKRESQDSYYLLRGSLIPDMAQNLVNAADKYSVNVSFQNYGYELSSDFNKKDPVSRQAALNRQTEQMQEIKDGGKRIMINMGNDYAVPYADMVCNMDLNGTKYTIIDRTIPFYQLALHGYLNYTGEPLNLTQNEEEMLLKSAEYGAGLSFTMMKETAFTLQNTLYSKYFGADYDAWHDRAVEIYTRYDSELGHIFNQRMADHEFITDMLTCTTYEDGTKVYVNYSYSDISTEGGVTVPARDYKVVR